MSRARSRLPSSVSGGNPLGILRGKTRITSEKRLSTIFPGGRKRGVDPCSHGGVAFSKISKALDGHGKMAKRRQEIGSEGGLWWLPYAPHWREEDKIK